jgi:hypothetical protein
MVARRLERPEHNVDAGLDVRIIVLELADRGLGAQQGRAAARTSMSSTTRSSGLPVWTAASRIGSSWSEESFFSWMRM